MEVVPKALPMIVDPIQHELVHRTCQRPVLYRQLTNNLASFQVLDTHLFGEALFLVIALATPLKINDGTNYRRIQLIFLGSTEFNRNCF